MDGRTDAEAPAVGGWVGVVLCMRASVGAVLRGGRGRLGQVTQKKQVDKRRLTGAESQRGPRERTFSR